MKNIIIFLYDASKDGELGTQSTSFERIMKSVISSKNKRTNIFYFKINSKPKFQSEETKMDEVFKYVMKKNGKNKEVLVKNGLNLRSFKDLTFCFKKIRKNIFCKNNYYFISCGHGSGFSIAPAFKLEIRNNLFENRPPNIDDNFFRHHLIFDSEREDIWEEEKIWNEELSNSLKILNPKLGVFYNCNTNFFDSLMFYSNCFHFSAGTENYLNNYMLDLDAIIKSLITLPKKITPSLLNKQFETIKNGFDRGLGIPKMKNASIFLINLKFIPQLITKFNELVEYILHYHSSDLKWFFEIQDAVQDQYISPKNSLIDIVHLLSSIGEKIKDNSLIIMIQDFQKFFITSEDGFLSNSHLKGEDYLRSGISIYYPIKNSGEFSHTNQFLKYQERYEPFLKKLKWYELLDKAIPFKPN